MIGHIAGSQDFNILKVIFFYVMANQLSEKVTPQERRSISWWMIYWIILINACWILFVCFYLKKYFDAFNHDLLLSKLQKYGVEDNELLWFTDYLSDRSQAVNVDGCISSFSNNNTGVPQGSVLGQLFFLIFINDLPTWFRNTLVNINADDTAIHVCDPNFKNIQKRFQEVDKVVQWFYSNRLVIIILNVVAWSFLHIPIK